MDSRLLTYCPLSGLRASLLGRIRQGYTRQPILVTTVLETVCFEALEEVVLTEAKLLPDDVHKVVVAGPSYDLPVRPMAYSSTVIDTLSNQVV